MLIGSVALKHWFPDFPHKTKDVDILSCQRTKNIPIPDAKVEIHNIEKAPSLYYIIENNKDDFYADPDMLYTLKVSHAAWDIHWDKTMAHIIFLKDKGCKVIPEFYDLLWKDWCRIHGDKSKIKLDMKNEEFFTEAVERTYDHDWLHGFLAFDSEPMHNKIRKNHESPLCSKELWLQLSHDDKIKCALEEIYVVATERYLFKNERKQPWMKAKSKSMKNLITSMTKGWFNLFLIDNFKELLYNDYDEHWHRLAGALDYDC